MLSLWKMMCQALKQLINWPMIVITPPSKSYALAIFTKERPEIQEAKILLEVPYSWKGDYNKGPRSDLMQYSPKTKTDKRCLDMPIKTSCMLKIMATAFRGYLISISTFSRLIKKLSRIKKSISLFSGVNELAFEKDWFGIM